MARPALAWAAIATVIVHIQEVAAPSGRGIGSRSVADLVGIPSSFSIGRVGFDSGLYLRVASVGYRYGEDLEAGFPGYAIAIRWLSRATGWDPMTAAVVFSAFAGLLVAVLVWRWAVLLGLDLRSRWVALLLVLLFPPAFLLFGVAYSDGLGLASVLAACVLAERRRWVGAGICGALATFSRPNALPIIVLLVGLALERSGALAWVRPARGRPRHLVERLRWWAEGVAWRPRRLRLRHGGVLLSVAGIGAYSLWLWGHAGDPLYFGWLQTHVYGHSPPWHPWAWLKVPVWRPLPNAGEWVHEAASFALIVGALASVPRVVRLLGAAYGVFVGLVVVQTWLGTYNVAPAGRYLLPCIPVLAVTWAPALAARRGLACAVLASAAITSAALAAGFAGAFPLNW